MADSHNHIYLFGSGLLAHKKTDSRKWESFRLRHNYSPSTLPSSSYPIKERKKKPPSALPHFLQTIASPQSHFCCKGFLLPQKKFLLPFLLQVRRVSSSTKGFLLPFLLQVQRISSSIFAANTKGFFFHKKAMEVEETKCSSGYGKPPWIFKGSALYQFHLVKAEIAKAIIPKEFRLVEAFGYTLGGFFLANYNESPFGTFDELVVIAGIVWNPPTSHAWAARVYVNSDEACRHGRKEFGLPSQVATFSKSIKAMPMRPRRKTDTTTDDGNMDIHVAEINGPVAIGLYDIPVLRMNPLKWMGMGIKMSLPSFSGHTEHQPQLLKYCCQIECRVKPTSPAKVLLLLDSESQNTELKESSTKSDGGTSVMLSKPILALEFNCLKMQVEPPVVVSKKHG